MTNSCDEGKCFQKSGIKPKQTRQDKQTEFILNIF